MSELTVDRKGQYTKWNATIVQLICHIAAYYAPSMDEHADGYISP